MTDELAKVLHDAARDSLEVSLHHAQPAPDYSAPKKEAEFAVTHLRFGERMALAVEMASILHDLADSKTISIEQVEGLLARWQECKP